MATEAINQGETSATSAKHTIKFTDADGKIRQVVLDTAALSALSGIPDTFTIRLREWDVCDEGVSKKAVFVSSDPY